MSRGCSHATEIGEHAQEYCEDAKDFNKNLIGRTLRPGYIRDRKPKYIKRLGKTDRCYLNIKRSIPTDYPVVLSSRPTIDFISPSSSIMRVGLEFKKSYTITLLHYFQKSIHRELRKSF